MARLIITVLLFAIPLRAQHPQNLPDAPKPKQQTCTSHPDRRIFWTGVSLLATSKIADAITTRQLLDRGGWENNAAFGRHPSAGKQAGINAAFFAGQTAVFYLTERNSRRWVRWTGRAYIGLVMAQHVQMAVCNSKIDPHSSAIHNCHSFLPL